MPSTTQTEARKIHDRLKHPVIDADGHWAEFAPHMREEFRKIGGGTAVGALAPARARVPPRASVVGVGRRPGPGGLVVVWVPALGNNRDLPAADRPARLAADLS